MGRAMFYHLTRRSLPQTLLPLLRRAIETGWRVELRGVAPARQEALSRALWQAEGFLPHGMAGGPQDADQPVLLTTEPADLPAPACVFAVDGARIDPGEVARLERACIFFDGADPGAVDAARGQWRTLTGAGVEAQYWAETDQGWEKKHDTGGAA